MGNKSDLEEDRQISREQGEKLAKRYKNCAFIETSAKLQTNVKEAFSILVKKIDESRGKKEKASCILV